MLIFFLSISRVFAQVTDPSVQGYNPGVLDRLNEFQLNKLRIEQNIIRKTPEAKPDEGLQKERDVQKGELIYNPHFLLNGIIFQGNTVYSKKKLEKLAQDLIGQEIYMEDILELTLEISRFYQKNGYITSYAYVPPQEVKEGVVIINIIESRIEQKIITGNRWEKSWYLENIVLGKPHLAIGKVFNVRPLQGALKSLNKESYMKANIEISKNPETEGTIIELKIEDRYPIVFDVSWDDYGRDFTGIQRITMLLEHENLTGFGDKAHGGVILSSGSQSILTGYSFPISTYGTRLAFEYAFLNFELGGPFRDLRVRGRANDYNIIFTQPIINNAVTDFTGYLSLSSLNSKANILALEEILTNYSLRILRVGTNYLHDDIYGRWLGNGEVDLGTKGLGSTPSSSSGPQSAFVKLKAELIRIQRLPKRILGILRINGQFSPQSLYSAEKMFLGGPYSIRGFQPAEILGDYGVAGSLEMRVPIPGFDKILPEKLKPLDDRIKIAGFYDWGWVNEHQAGTNAPVTFLHAVGFAAYLYPIEALSLQIGVGVPLGQRFVSMQNARMYFSLNSHIDKFFMKPVKKSN